MSSVPEATARLVLCVCREHAHLQLVDGQWGAEFGAKDAGLHSLREGVALGRNFGSQEDRLLAEINASPLPATVRAARREVLWGVEMLTASRSAFEGDLLCDYVHNFPLASVPIDFIMRAEEKLATAAAGRS